MRYQPSMRYAAWWQAVEACSGRTAPLGEITWYRAGAETIPDVGESYNGLTYQGDVPLVVIAGSHVNDGVVVRHEMLHVLLHRNGHPGEYFVKRCGGIVACGDACLREGGFPVTQPNPDTTIGAAALETTVHAYPNPVSLTADSGWLTVVVEAHNPLPREAFVALPQPSRLQRLFWYDLQAIRVDSIGTGYPNAVFAPAETQRLAFDLRVSPLTSTGARALRGGYSIALAPNDTVRIVP